VQGFQKDNLLGIQYWFYYPFHDDPGLDPHPHDWWYFWVVYDVSAKKPVKVIYDFHHNLRACDFTDTRVHREGIHVFTYHDAGGHRVMYGRGLDVPDFTSLWIGYQISQGGRPLYNTFEHGGLYSSDGDYTIGLMVDLLSANGELAPWRGVWFYFYDPWSGEGRWELLADWNAGVTLKVEDFQHWVWVYGVEPNKGEDSYGQEVDLVKFTETGMPFFDMPYNSGKPRDGKEYWPQMYYFSNYRFSTHLPWTSGISYHESTPISSTEMIWWYRQYDPTSVEKAAGHYTAGTLGSPTIFTRYYDGSP
ncbi:MAG: hypothetical protein QXE27_07525, partial [Thermoplasmata archaeon]